jgi:ice-binding like protein/Big-like domain-containing protein
MHKLKLSKVLIPVFLLAVVMAGCSDSDKAGSATSPLTPPTVTAVNPTGTLVCTSSAAITATFSKAMNPATINSTTFTLTGPSGSVTGAVAYIAATNVATFTPAPPGLAVTTTYTATISTGAADTFGNPLAANKVWTFTTATCSSSGGIPLGTACGFGILAGSTVTNSPIITGTTTHVTGDVGVSPGSAITGFPPGTATGPFFVGVGSLAGSAQMDLTTAYNAAAGAANTGGTLTGDIGGQTKPPGVYTATTTLGITGDLTLDGSTNPNGTWIFQVGSALTTAAGSPGTPASRVILINGAQAHNVFWQIGSSATLGTYSLFQGTIMAQASITLTTGATLNGRALARSGAVSLDSNAVNVPPCP